MDNRRWWGLLLAGMVACVAEKKESSLMDTAAETAADTAAACNDGMTKEEWIEAWRQSFCNSAVVCAVPVYGESMERCYENTTGPIDRCIDECRTAEVLAAMQAYEASGSCDGLPSEAGVPYCTE